MKTIAKFALNLLLPARCIACSEPVEETGAVCGECWKQLEFIASPKCRCCGYPLEQGALEDSICGGCIQQEPSFHQAASALVYNATIKEMITGFKYQDKHHAVKRLAEWMIPAGEQFWPQADFVVPVPLHWRKLFERRYNQAALLAQQISKRTGIALLPQALVRKRYDPPQASLTRIQRQERIARAFAPHPRYGHRLSGKTVVLIDDVMTTGATMNACSEALKKAGVQTVYGVSIARTILEKK